MTAPVVPIRTGLDAAWCAVLVAMRRIDGIEARQFHRATERRTDQK